MRTRVFDALDRHFTGLVKASFPPDRDVVLLVSDGVVRQVYVQGGYRYEFHHGNTWSLHLASRMPGRFWLQETPEQMLLFQRILVEQRDVGQRQGLSTPELDTFFRTCRKQERASLLQIRWKTAEAYVMVPGGGFAIDRAVFIGAEVCADEQAFQQIRGMNEVNCTVTVHEFGSGVASLEMYLNILFHLCANQWLEHFAGLAGFAMAEAVAESLREAASLHDCRFSVRGHRVADATIYEDAAIAAKVYRELLTILLDRLEQVFGPYLVSRLKQSTLQSLNAHYVNIMRVYRLVD